MAYENDILTRNDNDELAVRTVQTTGDNPGAYDDIYTRDNNGKLCVRVTGTGGGGSDPHNLGWYATQSALETAHPTAEDGDWAIVGSTDTVWAWDSDTNAWKDTDQKGQVESVNGQTGTVVLTASDVGAATTAQGAKADTAVQPGDLATVATSGSYNDLTNKPTIPTVGDGTITITQGGVTKGTFTTNQSGNTTINVDAGGSALPDQTGNAGKFLTTDGTDANWSDKPLVNTATGTNSLAIGPTSVLQRDNCVVLGSGASATDAQGTVVGQGANAAFMASAFGWRAKANASYAIQLGANKTNSDSNTFKVGNQNGNFEMMSADGTIPTARLTKVNTTITLAAADWSSNTQTVSVTGMTADGVVMVSPDPTDQSAYTSAGILCTAQAAGTLTFTCDTVPSGDLSVNVVML